MLYNGDQAPSNFTDGKKTGPGSVSNKQMARTQIQSGCLSVPACMSLHCSVQRDKELLARAHPRAVGQALPTSASQAAEGSGAVAESQPHRNTRCVAPGPGAKSTSVGISARSAVVLKRDDPAPEGRKNDGDASGCASSWLGWQ